MLYSCKPLFERIKAQAAAEIDGFPLEDSPSVCIITTRVDEPSARYVRNKLRDFAELGIEAEDTIEIKSGLKKGDNVVTKGQTYLSDGEEVTIANTAAKTKEKTKTTEKGE